jgi:hypothetical protein
MAETIAIYTFHFQEKLLKIFYSIFALTGPENMKLVHSRTGNYNVDWRR